MSPLGKGPIWLSILAETFWPVQAFEINMHHASKYLLPPTFKKSLELYNLQDRAC